MTTYAHAGERFWRWFRGSKVVDSAGRPLVLYHGTFNDFAAFDTDGGTTEGAAFFSVSPAVANAFADPTEWGLDLEDTLANVRPVLLAIRNPLRVGPAEVMRNGAHSFDAMRETIRAARHAGHDGLHIVGCREACDDDDQWAAFLPTQIKSAIGNSGRFDPEDPRITE